VAKHNFFTQLVDTVKRDPGKKAALEYLAGVSRPLLV